MLNPIEKLRSDLMSRFPNPMLEIEPPDYLEGRWFIDIYHVDVPYCIVVEWCPDWGFSIFPLQESDDSISDAQSVFDRVVQLILQYVSCD